MTRPSSTDETLLDAFVVGIFVGGRGRRLGGVVKGLLRTPSGETILERLAAVVREASGEAEIVLVGAHPSFEASSWPRLDDDPAGQGPLGGLAALLRHAARRGRLAIALASDLPEATPSLLERLMREAPGAAIYAPKLEGIDQPLFARYAPGAVLPSVDEALASPRKSLLGVLGRVGVTEMPVTADEASALGDWDEPSDLPDELRARLPTIPDESS
jgi:molybdopterin-guanine dinucleotide biosynthesis protein A